MVVYLVRAQRDGGAKSVFDVIGICRTPAAAAAAVREDREANDWRDADDYKVDPWTVREE